MGGCVAKKAYALARQDPTAVDIAGRVHSIFFLATPHRGSDMATVLENMLAVAWGKKPYVADLTPNSAALSAINDAFRHFAPELRLWSFYETLPMRSAGVINRIVVERHSATLGYHNEEVAAMDADHRHVSKFDSSADPNYRILRNALLTAVDLIRTATVMGLGSPPPGEGQFGCSRPTSQLLMSPTEEATSLLRSFLGIRESLEGDLATLQFLKQPGSCEWFTKTTSFASWRLGTSAGILWLVGKPAAGKSVLSGHVIEQLSSPQIHCSYFICKHAKAGESTLSRCFRSLAFQMAMQDTSVQEALLQLARQDLIWDKTDDTVVWRRLFTGCIFKLPCLERHFWVIDAIDECANFNALFTKRLLATVPDSLRLFATSRNLDEIERGLTSLGPSRASIQILSDADTVEDMRLFLVTRLAELGRPDTVEDRERMCEKILTKSRGSFLWARLVLQEFEEAWTEEAMDDVLREIPADLFELYSRMVQSIETDKRKLTLARSILTWVVLACRPLTVDELRSAVKLDINQTLQNAAKAIPDLCGQLVFIDQHDKVQLIHETAQEFLVADSPGQCLSIHKKEGHTRLASLLLRYLCTPVLKPPQAKAQQNSGRSRGFAKSAPAGPPIDTSLVEYACSFFSEHVYCATLADDLLMDAVSAFLGANTVLSWIEHVAKGGDLTPLIRAATNLREYLIRRTNHISPTDKSFQLVDGWVTDLIRVAAKFRAELLDCPSSIHTLIPPLCPSESLIARTFGRASGLLIMGPPAGAWDDCLIRMDFRNGLTTAVSHGDRLFAIGLSLGQVSVYDSASLQVQRQMKHPEHVKILQFSPQDVLLASSGYKHLVIWDLKTGTASHAFDLQSQAMAITFLGLDEILGAFHSCELTKWYVKSPLDKPQSVLIKYPWQLTRFCRVLKTEERESISWKSLESRKQGDKYQIRVPSMPPGRVAFLTTPDEILLAVGYRANPVLVWNALELELLGACQFDGPNNGIVTMAFSPNPEIPALIVSIQDGGLYIFDYQTMEMRVRQSEVYASTIACSSDGRTILIGSPQGVIEIFDLEHAHNGAITLSVIYRNNPLVDGSIRGVALSPDALRFVDVRAQQGRVWAPAALVRKSSSELESSIGTAEGDATLFLPPKRSGGMFSASEDPEITTTLIPSTDARFIVAGNANGEVVLFSTADSSLLRVLYRHPSRGSIVSLVFVESRNFMVSADDGGRVVVVDMEAELSKVAAMPEVKQPTTVLNRLIGEAVVGVLANLAGDRVLVCGRHMTQLWEIPSGTVHLVGGCQPSAAATSESTASPWESVFQHPTNLDWFVVITKDVARVYSWGDLTELTAQEGIRLARVPALDAPLARSEYSNSSYDTSAASYHPGPGFVIELFRPSKYSSARLYLWPGSQLDPASQTRVARPAVEPNLDAVSPAVSAVLRVIGTSTVLFLDIKRWVCSVELQSVTAATTDTPRSTAAAFGTGSYGSANASPASLPSSSLSSMRSLQPGAHARRHFFALSEWRTGLGRGFRCAVAVPGRGSPAGGGRDVVAFAAGHRLVVVRGGLEFSESVAIASNEVLGRGVGGQNVWDVVVGSMHRRSSNW